MKMHSLLFFVFGLFMLSCGGRPAESNLAVKPVTGTISVSVNCSALRLAQTTVGICKIGGFLEDCSEKSIKNGETAMFDIRTTGNYDVHGLDFVNPNGPAFSGCVAPPGGHVDIINEGSYRCICKTR